MSVGRDASVSSISTVSISTIGVLVRVRTRKRVAPRFARGARACENLAMAGVVDALDRGRAAFEAGRWLEAFDALVELDASIALEAEDVEALGEAAWWLGRPDDCVAARQRAFAAYVSAERPRRAASVALRLFYSFSVRGDAAIASGWLRRAERLLGDEPEGVEHGHLRLAEARAARAHGDVEGELGAAREAVALGRRFADADLVALGQYVEGRVLVRRGSVDEGMAILDEAMLAAAQGELGAMSAGQVYCNVIAACQELGDLRRAAEWTQALRSWSATQPASVFPGLCRVHRAEVLALRGDWTEAEDEARRACVDLVDVMPAFAAEGFYEVGEVRRRLGDLAGAEAAFRRAGELGREPQPGLALVRLAQGRSDAAAAAVRGALAEESSRLARAKLLPAQVTIAIACDDLDTASGAVDELDAVAADYASPALEAAAASARGELELTGDDPEAARGTLRHAWQLWRAAECPFEAAEARRTLGLACRKAGDQDGAEVALSAAHTAFEQLGAARDAARTAELLGTSSLPAGLTAREAEVLRLVASGKSNREIGAELHLSVKTVARHLSNIFVKLGVSSRTAATAFAYKHGLTDER
jgi:ATP/maltotriose-dependent transcriptional regulator MalT